MNKETNITKLPKITPLKTIDYWKYCNISTCSRRLGFINGRYKLDGRYFCRKCYYKMLGE